MLSKNQIKYIQSLHQKKSRVENEKFLVEGTKSVLELLDSDFKIEQLIGTQAFFDENILPAVNCTTTVVTEEILSKISALTHNNTVLAVVHMLPSTFCKSDNDWVLVLDDIKDPGNLGTIIRIADWYGITKIVCSEQTVEYYNPKVIAATMGSFTRILPFYTDLLVYFRNLQSNEVYGAYMNGQSVYSTHFKSEGYIVIGNESNGISNNLSSFITNPITIPKRGHAESLNAGVATAIILDNIFRN